MRNWLKILFFNLCLLGPSWATAAYWIDADSWARPRDGAALVTLPALSQAVQEWMRQPGAQLLLRYPGGEEGTVWAHELRAWLVALGIPSSAIELVAGSRREDALELDIQRRDEQELDMQKKVMP